MLPATLYGTARGTYDAELMGLSLYRQTTPISPTIDERDPAGLLLAPTDGTTVYYFGLDGRDSVVTHPSVMARCPLPHRSLPIRTISAWQLFAH